MMKSRKMKLLCGTDKEIALLIIVVSLTCTITAKISFYRSVSENRGELLLNSDLLLKSGGIGAESEEPWRRLCPASGDEACSG
jgi:hypothetical protein